MFSPKMTTTCLIGVCVDAVSAKLGLASEASMTLVVSAANLVLQILQYFMLIRLTPKPTRCGFTCGSAGHASARKPPLSYTSVSDHALQADHERQGCTTQRCRRLVRVTLAPLRSSCQPPPLTGRRCVSLPGPDITEARPPAVRQPSEMDRAQVCPFRSRHGRQSRRNDPSDCARSGDAQRSFETMRWRLHAAV